jgi:2-dehydro-3-deoxygalactonokinase
MRIVAVDGGTTSTRAWVVDDGEISAGERASGGARDVAGDRDRAWLGDLVAEVARKALAQTGKDWAGVEAVVAFGMITSELGLAEVPHLPAPAGIADLAAGMRRCADVPSIPAPLYLVPGVINRSDDLAGCDFMRGEETQVVGLIDAGEAAPPLLYVSAGSHAKFIKVGDDAAIRWSFTTLSGELLWALARETILASVLDPTLPVTDEDAVDRGCALEEAQGLSRALYAGRLLNRVEGADAATCTDFLRGAVAAADLRGLRHLEDLPPTVVVGAGSGLGPVYARLLRREPWVRSCVSSELPLGALGAWRLWTTARADRQELR